MRNVLELNSNVIRTFKQKQRHVKYATHRCLARIGVVRMTETRCHCGGRRPSPAMVDTFKS